MRHARFLITATAAIWLAISSAAAMASSLPIADAHVHYSHDSVDLTPPERVVELMREANLKFALVSSSDDTGTQLLSALAPDLIVPGLRPYTRRGQTSSWFEDEDNLAYVESLLEQHRYATIGEFHLFGKAADLPIPRRVVALAEQYNLILHAHSDAEAVQRLLAHSPTVKVIWAHAGFADPEAVGEMLEQHDRLWADLAFRSDLARGGILRDDWRALFERFPERLMLGTDTYTPERMYFIPAHAEAAREWLGTLPPDLAEAIAWKNAHALIMPVWQSNRAVTAEPTDVCSADKKGYELSNGELRALVTPIGHISVSEAFDAVLTVCGEALSTATVSLDARMPAHGHGMNYEPTITRIDTADHYQQYRLEGLVLHMPGTWQWQVDVRTDDTRNTLQQDFDLR